MFLPSDIQSIPKEITSRTSTRTILVGILVNDDFRLRTWLQLVHVFGRITQGTLEMTKLQEQLANPIPVEETIPKKELMSLLECPVCLDHFKPPLQVYKICFAQYWSFINIPPDMAMSRRPCYLLELQNQARVEGVPPVSRQEVQKLLKKQDPWRIIEKDVPRVGRKEGSRSWWEDRSCCRGG